MKTRRRTGDIVNKIHLHPLLIVNEACWQKADNRVGYTLLGHAYLQTLKSIFMSIFSHSLGFTGKVFSRQDKDAGWLESILPCRRFMSDGNAPDKSAPPPLGLLSY